MNYIDSARHPLLHRISQEAEWTAEDEFPASLQWADEHEEWLRFANRKGELDRFFPRLQKSAYQRDRALAEVGVGYFLEVKCSLPILEWEPPGRAGTKGEFIVGWSGGKLFVEIKTGGWQKDIKDAEGKNSPRLSQPKYIHAEARSVAPWAIIRGAVSNAYSKFPDSMPTLLIIKDDYFIGLDNFNADIALYCPASGGRAGGYLAENGCFVDTRYERLGSVGILNVELPAGGLQYGFFLCDNTNADRRVILPQGIFQGYQRYNATNRPK